MENLEEYLKQFSFLVCNIGEDEDATYEEISDYFKKNPIVENEDYGKIGRVWILIGKENSAKPYESLIVAQSENIYDEIVHDVGAMYNKEYKRQREDCIFWNFEQEIRYNLDVIKTPQIAKINSNDNYFLHQKGHYKIKNQYLYRQLKKTYEVLKIYEWRKWFKRYILSGKRLFCRI